MRKQNKLFENLSQSYAMNGFGEGIEYKGHKLCITAFEVTPTHIYSCSKDKSIINGIVRPSKSSLLVSERIQITIEAIFLSSFCILIRMYWLLQGTTARSNCGTLVLAA